MRVLLSLVLSLLFVFEASASVKNYIPAWKIKESTSSVEKGVRQSGDLDGDGKISSSDGRLALRIAVELEKADDREKAAGDIFSDGKISSSGARRILRAAVGLEEIPVRTYKVRSGEKFFIGPFADRGGTAYEWQLEGSEIPFEKEVYYPLPSANVGVPQYSVFTFSPGKGTYEISFVLKSFVDGSIAERQTVILIF